MFFLSLFAVGIYVFIKRFTDVLTMKLNFLLKYFISIFAQHLRHTFYRFCRFSRKVDCRQTVGRPSAIVGQLSDNCRQTVGRPSAIVGRVLRAWFRMVCIIFIIFLYFLMFWIHFNYFSLFLLKKQWFSRVLLVFYVFC